MEIQNRTFEQNLTMSKILSNEDPKYVFAALKLIERLYHDKLISERVFRNILNDCADIVDLSQFVIYEGEGKEENNV
ncbi:MAG: hypothetical protein K6F76_03190 [Clostridiales bacterium]|nr:hypothetical protein [Clostridiales bacterium]